jgi:hypothetical protein
MFYDLLASAVILLHFGFVLFVVAGGLLLYRWPWLAWIHLPAVIWAALLEFNGWICPLTPLEQHLRAAAGQAGYSGGFVDHYLLPLLYPVGLDGDMQLILGSLVVIINVLVYGVLGWHRKGRRLPARRR